MPRAGGASSTLRRFGLSTTASGILDRPPSRTMTPSVAALSPVPSLLIRPELELAVAFQIRAAAHVELAVVADEEQRAFRYLLGALQKFTGIAGAHLVGEGLAVLVIGVAGVGLELPRCCSGLRQCGCSERAEHGRHQKYPCRKCHHPILPIEAPGLNKSRTALPGQFAKAPQRITSCRAVCDFPFVPARLCSAFRLERNSTKTLGRG